MGKEFMFACKGSGIQFMGCWEGGKPKEEVVPRLWENVFCYENFGDKYFIGVWSDTEEKAKLIAIDAYKEILRRKKEEISRYIHELDAAAGGV